MVFNQIVGGVMMVLSLVSAGGSEAPRAARSVHLGWAAPEGTLFYLEMAVEQSTAGSYFMACGWNTGYFGIQELEGGRKVALFSVWDPTEGDDPGVVKSEDRVEVLHAAEMVRIRRFGGEGTGGQCMLDFPWKIGETHRFLVQTVVEGDKTRYAGYLYFPDSGRWHHLVTFRTRTGGQPLKGYYSFVEDFRRDGESPKEVRKARFMNGWVQTVKGEWVSLTRARFTASGAEWESKENINAGISGSSFFLATGGGTRQEQSLQTFLGIHPPGLALPPGVLP
jgi:hypothetical protein